MKAGNQTLLKKNNQRAIADCIIKNGPISRAELSKRLSISKPTVSANIAELMEMDLLREIGYSCAEIGKKPMLLDFNKEYRYVLAMDFISYYTRNRISIAACNLYCEPVFIETVTLPENYSGETLRTFVPAALDGLCRRNQLDIQRIGKVVLTAPTIEYDADYVKFECRNGDIVNLVECVKPFFSGRIAVKNDINLAALGEKYFGVGRDVDNLFFAWISNGVGGGLILNGQLHEGFTKTGGEIAYSTVYNEATGRMDYFRNLTDMGGIRTYISAKRREAEGSIIAQQLLTDRFTLDMLINAARQGDAFCIEFGSFIGRTASVLVANICSTMDLQMEIIGGDYLGFGEVFLKPFRERIDSLPIGSTRVTTPFYTNSAMYGAFKFGADSIIASLIE